MKKIILFSTLLFFFICSCTKESAPVNVPAVSEKLFPKVKTIVTTSCTVTCHAPSMGFNTGLPVILENDTDIVYHAAAIKASVADPVTPTNHRMPQGGSLSAADIDIIVRWAAAGGTSHISPIHQ